MSLPLELMEALAIAFVFVWLFCLGATVGSFLNVVVWRLPRRLSLVHPGSLCPVCHHPIRLHDNIPVLSWLVLRGRCRDCKTPIPIRYLLVELATGTIFLALAVWRTLGPAATPQRLDPRWLLSWNLAGPFWIDYLQDVILLSTLLAAGLIEADGFTVPWRIWWPTYVFSLLHPTVRWVLWREDRLFVAAGPGMELIGPQAMFLLRPWVGLAFGLAMGGLVQWMRRAAGGRDLAVRPVAVVLAATGAALGWSATLRAGCGGMVLLALGRLVRRGIPTAAAVGGMVVVELVGVGQRVERITSWGGGLSAWLMPAGYLALALAAAGLLGRWERSYSEHAGKGEQASSPSPVASVEVPSDRPP
jgi:leader peptidase (prepilin peptidase)/N-methyltransferase